MEYEGGGNTTCYLCTLYNPQRTGTGAGDLRRLACHSDSSGKPSANVNVKNTQMNKKNNLQKIGVKKSTSIHNCVGTVNDRELCKNI